MRARIALSALILASILPASSAAQDQEPQATVTAGWAGIWQVNEETRDCTTGALLGTASYLDTLCTGDAFFVLPGQYLDQSGYHYATCGGAGFTDTSLDLSCAVSAVCGCHGTCNAYYTRVASWTRSGDEATTSVTYTANYGAPGGCAPPNSCQRTTGTRTRIESGAVACPTAPPLEGALDLDPANLNLHSRAHWLTAHITPPSPFAADQIDVNSLLLNGVPYAPEFEVRTEADNTVLRVRFDRQAVTATLTPGDSVPVTVAGTVGAEGTRFEAVAHVVVHGEEMGTPLAGAHYAPGSSVPVSWQLPTIGAEPTVTLLSTFDDGQTWNVEAEGIPNSGSTTWTAPLVAVPAVQLAIAYVLTYDETGPVNRTEYAVSGPFSIEAVTAVGVESAANGLHAVSPQPSRGSFKVSFRLPFVGPARLEILDLAGRRVAGQHVVGAGLHQIEFGRGELLQPSVYVVRLSQAGQTWMARAVVLR